MQLMYRLAMSVVEMELIALRDNWLLITFTLLVFFTIIALWDRLRKMLSAIKNVSDFDTEMLSVGKVTKVEDSIEIFFTLSDKI